MATSANPASRNRNARYGQELLDVVVLAAEKLRPGGTMVVTAGPGERDPSYQRPVHPAYLAFLFREAGFADVAVEDGTVIATR